MMTRGKFGEPWEKGPAIGHPTRHVVLVCGAHGPEFDMVGDDLRKTVKRRERVIACVNALDGMEPDRVTDVIEAAKAIKIITVGVTEYVVSAKAVDVLHRTFAALETPVNDDPVERERENCEAKRDAAAEPEPYDLCRCGCGMHMLEDDVCSAALEADHLEDKLVAMVRTVAERDAELAEAKVEAEPERIICQDCNAAFGSKADLIDHLELELAEATDDIETLRSRNGNLTTRIREIDPKVCEVTAELAEAKAEVQNFRRRVLRIAQLAITGKSGATDGE